MSIRKEHVKDVPSSMEDSFLVVADKMNYKLDSIAMRDVGEKILSKYKDNLTEETKPDGIIRV